MTNFAAPGPMRLSKRQQEVLDAVLEFEGNSKRAADKLGITYSTFEAHLRSARLRMNAPTRLWLFVLWDRNRQRTA